MKKIILCIGLLLILLILTACQSTTTPLLYAMPTASTLLSESNIVSATTQTQSETYEATLYFRLSGQPLLVGETRALTINRNESIETALIRELVQGPSSDQPALERVLPEDTTLIQWSAVDNILYLTFDDAWLDTSSLPSNWELDPTWQVEAPLQRLLIIQSVVATITENLPYTAVQFLFQSDSAVTTDARMQLSFFLDGQQGVSDPQYRMEQVLLTPYTLTSQILQSWQKRDYQTLYAHIGTDSNYPNYQSFCLALESMQTLVQFSISPGTVSQNGQTAIVTINYFAHDAEKIVSHSAYPLRLYLQNGIWKISYDTLLQLLGYEG